MQERLKVKVQDAPCFGKDGLAGKVAPLLSASACGRSILKTQDHPSLHGSIGQPICQIPFPCRSATRELRSQGGSLGALCDELSANDGSPSIPSAFVKSLA